MHWGNCSFLSTLRFLRLLKLRQVFSLLFFPELLRWPRFFQSPAVGHLNTLVDGLDSTHPPPLPNPCFCAYSHWFWALTAFHFFTSLFPLGLEESQDFFSKLFSGEHSSEKNILEKTSFPSRFWTFHPYCIRCFCSHLLFWSRVLNSMHYSPANKRGGLYLISVHFLVTSGHFQSVSKCVWQSPGSGVL